MTHLQPDTSYSYVIDNSDEAYAPTRCGVVPLLNHEHYLIVAILLTRT